ncbi:MAG: hypothetical protein WD208_12395 [Dehalococcoidia bacterium]
MTEQQTEAFDLARRVRDMVSAYVYKRTDARSNVQWADFKNRWITNEATGSKRRDVPQAYLAAREKVCRETFLALRSRRNREDFVAYFTGTICSVPQFLPESEYQGIATAMLERSDAWEDVKSLSMLAVSSLAHI